MKNKPFHESRAKYDPPTAGHDFGFLCGWNAAMMQVSKLLAAKAVRYIDQDALDVAEVLRESEVEVLNEIHAR